MKNSLTQELIAERRIDEFTENIQDGIRVGVGNPQYRSVAGRAFIGMAGVWRLSDTEAAKLLSNSESELKNWVSEGFDGLVEEHLEKISSLLGIYKCLDSLYSGQINRMGRWLAATNAGPVFDGDSSYGILAGADQSVYHLVRQTLAAQTV